MGRGFGEVGAAERLSRAGPAGGATGGLRYEPGYPDVAETKEATATQIIAQTASDRSNVTIKFGPVSGRSSGVRFWNSSAGCFQSFAV